MTKQEVKLLCSDVSLASRHQIQSSYFSQRQPEGRRKWAQNQMLELDGNRFFNAVWDELSGEFSGEGKYFKYWANQPQREKQKIASLPEFRRNEILNFFTMKRNRQQFMNQIGPKCECVFNIPPLSASHIETTLRTPASPTIIMPFFHSGCLDK